MKVFLSWSGEHSKKLTKVFADWIPSVIQSIETYYSPEDLSKGGRWFPDISNELEQSNYGLIFLTKENLDSSWIMFEAGALSKKVSESKVCPIVFGIGIADIKGPLTQFQASVFSKEEIAKIMNSINSELSDNKLEQKSLEKFFEKWWPDLEKRIELIMKEDSNIENKVKKSQQEMLLDEILISTREISNSLSSLRNTLQEDAKTVYTDKDLELAYKYFVEPTKKNRNISQVLYNKVKNERRLLDVLNEHNQITTLLDSNKFILSSLRKELDEVTKGKKEGNIDEIKKSIKDFEIEIKVLENMLEDSKKLRN